MKKIVIAIDGYSSCGKSTFAKAVAARLGYIFIDTGAMYRALTLAVLRLGILDNTQAVVQALPSINVNFRFNPALGHSEVYLGGENVDSEIRLTQVSSAVSRVSQIAAVRTKLVTMQQAMGADKGIVMDGRDIGTVVFPDAELKIFMTADAHIRAVRRYDELKAKGQEVSLEQIETNIRERDTADETRAESPLRRASDALLLDNSHMSVEQQMQWLVGLLETV